MAIIVKNKNIKETIEDENGNVLGEIQYNPEDTTTYSKLCNILDDILKINSKLKEVSGIKNFSEKLNSIDEFEQHSEDFNKIKKGNYKGTRKQVYIYSNFNMYIILYEISPQLFAQ